MKTNREQTTSIRTKSLDEINRILQKEKEELYKRYKVKEIGIFGSFVRGVSRKRGAT